ncbi:MAG TPA: hypothetical protein PK286_01565 [Devosia sp.]|nr:hypothetical protein [Devosia sp.]
MKTTVLAMLSLVALGVPALAAESPAVCASDPAAAALAGDVAAKLPTAGQQVPDGFHLTLTCALLDSGFKADEIAALPPDALLDRAMEGLTIDRSRADALLAILQAMKQAQPIRPEPQVVK